MTQNKRLYAYILTNVLKSVFRPPKIPYFENLGKILNVVHPSLIMNPHIKFHDNRVKTSRDMAITYRFYPQNPPISPPKIPDFQNLGIILDRVHHSLMMNPHIKFHDN